MNYNYYYLVTSLPTLSPDTPPPIRREDFLTLCKGHVKRSDFDTLKSIQLVVSKQKEIPSGVLGAFLNFERGLKNALARLRSQRLGVEIQNFISRETPDHEQRLIAEEAFHAPSPLKGEEILNKARWRYLDELEFGHYFDRHRLFIFFIKLLILERVALFDPERGMRTLRSILNLEQVKTHYFNVFNYNEK
ncbi:MAG: hypothetical protein SCALA701_01750 [Candidatus Scalindua sp.]|nr:DUF2764 family protein [Planctomycetota bacterium]GJQ57374.1 MAG: hypothetical protein SCALA701_01750 [Candidatus Scalindua sp.]